MMTAIRSSKLVGPVSIMLTMVMLALLAPTSVLPVAEAQGQNRLLLLFPVVDDSAAGYDDVATRMTDYLQMALNQNLDMRVAEFSRTNPLVLRAVQEGQIRSVDLETEVRDPITAIQMAYALNADEICMATITSIQTQEDPLRVELLLNGQCYDVMANIDEDTMQVAERPVPSNTFGVSGSSNVREGYTGAVGPLLREAMRDAAAAAASVLSGEPAEEAAVKKPRRDDMSWRWVVAAALIAGLVVATNGGDGGEPGPAPQALAPQPLRLEIEPSAIELFWAPPNTTLTLLRYDLQRSIDNGATWNPVPGSQGNVLPDHTVFADFAVVAGQSYRYRIRAQYATTGPSAWAQFDDVQFPG
ncbi:MAG: hypothetical protein ACOX9R_08830 [Armatimonadota bacterium]|jgi:hypothetical protein